MTMGTSAGLETQEKEPTEEKAKPNCTLFCAKHSAFPLAPPLMQILCPGSSCDPPPDIHVLAHPCDLAPANQSS
ncbi:unnamed protein product [Rangifer tarandus platyrhynchus]|uniref:Uncharacterized protein n=1 Tax=Rangifer tarandus platyrhynchus TaxID=3082113 RepID=A0ABN8Y4U3_RANTA|nr:unnamed protein product [Rangifer tarandus platyrhynchus]